MADTIIVGRYGAVSKDEVPALISYIINNVADQSDRQALFSEIQGQWQAAGWGSIDLSVLSKGNRGVAALPAATKKALYPDPPDIAKSQVIEQRFKEVDQPGSIEALHTAGGPPSAAVVQQQQQDTANTDAASMAHAQIAANEVHGADTDAASQFRQMYDAAQASAQPGIILSFPIYDDLRGAPSAANGRAPVVVDDGKALPAPQKGDVEPGAIKPSVDGGAYSNFTIGDIQERDLYGRGSGRSQAAQADYLKGLQSELVRAGYLNQGDFTPGHLNVKTTNAFSQFLQQAALNNYNGQIDSWQNQLASEANDADNGKSGKSQSRTTLSSRADAEATLKTALESKLGRAPTQDDVNNFLSLLNQKETDNPQVSTQDASGNITTTGGMDQNAADLLAGNYADSHYGQQEAQSNAVGYFKILSDMVGAGGMFGGGLQ